MKTQEYIEKLEELVALYESSWLKFSTDKLTEREILQDELASLKSLVEKENDVCTCKEEHDVNIISLEPPVAKCTNCGKYIYESPEDDTFCPIILPVEKEPEMSAEEWVKENLGYDYLKSSCRKWSIGLIAISAIKDYHRYANQFKNK